MIKIHIVGRDLEKIQNLKEKLRKCDCIYSEEEPELIIVYGGDGMFLIAERIFPSVPKILLKGSEISSKGYDIDIEEAIKLYIEKKYFIEKIKKLKATHIGYFETRELLAINDIVITNSLPTEAIRFKVKINGESLGENFIGDGVVISTPYGSGGYFSSITNETFKSGIGLAFNNITKSKEYIILKEEDKIEVEITRGPAVLVSDNNRDFISIEHRDKVFIEQTEEVANRVVLYRK